MNRTTRVLFLSTGDSCRARMAEGWAKHLGGDVIEVKSAGFETQDRNPRTIAVMHERGIHIWKQKPTALTSTLLDWADLIVAIGNRSDEYCLVLPPGKAALHWTLADPAKAAGAWDEILAQFRETRDDLGLLVAALIEEISIMQSLQRA